jgi:hypothetical protein
VRVSIPVPTGVLLCAYKFGFGLAQKFLEKFQNFLSLGSSNSPVWHRTLHCALSGALAWPQLALPLCKLSGVHETVCCSLSDVSITVILKHFSHLGPHDSHCFHLSYSLARAPAFFPALCTPAPPWLRPHSTPSRAHCRHSCSSVVVPMPPLPSSVSSSAHLFHL